MLTDSCPENTEKLGNSYVNQTEAFALGLAYVAENGTVIMKGDDSTYLSDGQSRNRCGFFRLFFNALHISGRFPVCESQASRNILPDSSYST